MRRNRISRALAFAAVVALAAVAVWGFRMVPDSGLRWFFLGAILPGVWTYVELAQVRGPDPEVGEAAMAVHRYVVAFAGFLLASLVGSKLLVFGGVLDREWLSTVERLRWLAVGGGMVVFGNHLPTLRSPWPLRHQPFAWQQVHRFVGWTLVVGGLAIIILETSLPTDSARTLSTVVVAMVLTLSVGRKFASLAASSLRTADSAE